MTAGEHEVHLGALLAAPVAQVAPLQAAVDLVEHEVLPEQAEVFCVITRSSTAEVGVDIFDSAEIPGGRPLRGDAPPEVVAHPVPAPRGGTDAPRPRPESTSHQLSAEQAIDSDKRDALLFGLAP